MLRTNATRPWSRCRSARSPAVRAWNEKPYPGGGGLLPSASLSRLLLFASLLAATASACDLVVTDAWIRKAPPGTTTLAGYMVLSNKGAQALGITAITSPNFVSIQSHESVEAHGMVSMHSMDHVVVPARDSLIFAPGGRHLMLVGVRGLPATVAHVPITFTDSMDCDATVEFEVRPLY